MRSAPHKAKRNSVDVIREKTVSRKIPIIVPTIGERKNFNLSNPSYGASFAAPPMAGINEASNIKITEGMGMIINIYARISSASKRNPRGFLAALGSFKFKSEGMRYLACDSCLMSAL